MDNENNDVNIESKDVNIESKDEFASAIDEIKSDICSIFDGLEEASNAINNEKERVDLINNEIQQHQTDIGILKKELADTKKLVSKLLQKIIGFENNNSIKEKDEPITQSEIKPVVFKSSQKPNTNKDIKTDTDTNTDTSQQMTMKKNMALYSSIKRTIVRGNNRY